MRLCSFDPCARPVVAKSLCNGHYAQQKRGRSLTPLKERRSSLVRDAEGRKQCRGCDSWKPESDYGKKAANADGLVAYCLPCQVGINRKSRMNITPEEYAARLLEQDAACAICSRTDSGPKGWAVDHDHACCSTPAVSCGKCIRGLLCTWCNVALGYMNDDPARLRAAADYIEKNLIEAEYEIQPL